MESHKIHVPNHQPDVSVIFPSLLVYSLLKTINHYIYTHYISHYYLSHISVIYISVIWSISSRRSTTTTENRWNALLSSWKAQHSLEDFPGICPGLGGSTASLEWIQGDCWKVPTPGENSSINYCSFLTRIWKITYDILCVYIYMYVNIYIYTYCIIYIYMYIYIHINSYIYIYIIYIYRYIQINNYIYIYIYISGGFSSHV